MGRASVGQPVINPKKRNNNNQHNKKKITPFKSATLRIIQNFFTEGTPQLCDPKKIDRASGVPNNREQNETGSAK